MVSRATWLSLMTFTLACSGVRLRPHSPVALPQELATRGERIYLGSTFPLEGAEPSPLFVYERRVEARGEALRSTHVTRSPDGAVAVAEEATHDAQYGLFDYALLTDQQGQTGSIHVGEQEVTFTLEGTTKTERRAGPVVVGPTLVGYVVTRLEALRRGETLGVRFAVLERFETLGFDLQQVKGEPGQTRISMKPQSGLIALVVKPIVFTFDDASGHLLRLEGRVPPRRVVEGRLQELDARVEYAFAASAYR